MSQALDSDGELAAIVAGDAAAFGRWVAGVELRLRLSLASFAARVDTEAVVQETLLRTWQVAPRLVHDGKPEMLLRFAIRVARNLAISEVRRLKSRPEPSHELAAGDEVAVECRPVLADARVREAMAGCG